MLLANKSTKLYPAKGVTKKGSYFFDGRPVTSSVHWAILVSAEKYEMKK